MCFDCCCFNALPLLHPATYFVVRYIKEMNIAENINLPPTLLSRFDLIYLVLDKHDEAKDAALGRHLVSLFYEDSQVPTSIKPVSTSLKQCPMPSSHGVAAAMATDVLGLTLLPYPYKGCHDSTAAGMHVDFKCKLPSKISSLLLVHNSSSMENRTGTCAYNVCC